MCHKALSETPHRTGLGGDDKWMTMRMWYGDSEGGIVNSKGFGNIRKETDGIPKSIIS